MFDLNNVEYITSIQDSLGDSLQTLSAVVDLFSDYKFTTNKGLVLDYPALTSCLGFDFNLNNKKRFLVAVVDDQVLNLAQYIDSVEVCKTVNSSSVLIPTYCFVMNNYVVEFGNWMYRSHLFLTDALYYLIQYYNISLDKLEQNNELYLKAGNDYVWRVNLKSNFKTGYTKIFLMRGLVV